MRSEVLFEIEQRLGAHVLRLTSNDGMNRLSRECVLSLTQAIRELSRTSTPLVITGNDRFFSTGADLQEISALDGPEAYEFSKKWGMRSWRRSRTSLHRYAPPYLGIAWAGGWIWRSRAVTESRIRTRFLDIEVQP